MGPARSQVDEMRKEMASLKRAMAELLHGQHKIADSISLAMGDERERNRADVKKEREWVEQRLQKRPATPSVNKDESSVQPPSSVIQEHLSESARANPMPGMASWFQDTFVATRREAQGKDTASLSLTLSA